MTLPIVERLRFGLPFVNSSNHAELLEAADTIEELVEMLEVLRIRECGSWCDPSLDEHTSYCRDGKALLAKIGGDA